MQKETFCNSRPSTHSGRREKNSIATTLPVYNYSCLNSLHTYTLPGIITSFGGEGLTCRKKNEPSGRRNKPAGRKSEPSGRQSEPAGRDLNFKLKPGTPYF